MNICWGCDKEFNYEGTYTRCCDVCHVRQKAFNDHLARIINNKSHSDCGVNCEINASKSKSLAN